MNNKTWIRTLSIGIIFLTIVSGGLILMINQTANGLQESVGVLHDIKESDCLTGNNSRAECVALSKKLDYLYNETKTIEIAGG